MIYYKTIDFLYKMYNYKTIKYLYLINIIIMSNLHETLKPDSAIIASSASQKVIEKKDTASRTLN